MTAEELAAQLAHEAEISTAELLARLAARGGTDCRAAAMRIQQQDETLKIMAAELAALREQVRWRKVEEELPKATQRVIVMTDGAQRIAAFFATDNTWLCNSFDKTITHWQPLPEPPKEESE